MASITLARTTWIPVLVVAWAAAGCASGVTSGTTASTTTSTTTSTTATTSVPQDATTTTTTTGAEIEGGEAGSANAGLASAEFVTAAMTGGDAVAFLAPGPADNPGWGAPYDPALLTARLGELADLAAATVTPSATACDDGSGVVCQVDLTDRNGRQATTVVVRWIDDGVSDFTIVGRRPDGSPEAVGRARCSQGLSLIHGGHAVDRFDIALCSDASGGLEYNGANRTNDQGLRLAACAAGPDRWEATNEGYTYVVDGTASPTRSRLQVIDPAGETLLETYLTAVRFPPSAELDAC